MCEKFSAGQCLGCNGFEEDIDAVKELCPDYIEWRNENAKNKRIITGVNRNTKTNK